MGALFSDSAAIPGSCHCGAVQLTVPAVPATITRCNCSLCRRHGVLWGYYPIAEASIVTSVPQQTYAWGGRNVDFHRCGACGCLTHWQPRKASRTSMGINMRLFDPALLAGVEIIYKDSAGTGIFL